MKRKIASRLLHERQTLTQAHITSIKSDHLSFITRTIFPIIRGFVKERKERVYQVPWRTLRRIPRPIRLIKRLKQRTDSIIQKLSDSLDQPIRLVFTRRMGAAFESPNTIYIPHPGRVKETVCFYQLLLHESAHAACEVLNIKFRSEVMEEITVELATLVVMLIEGYNIWDHSLSYVQEHHDYKYPLSDRHWKRIEKETLKIVKFFLLR